MLLLPSFGCRQVDALGTANGTISTNSLPRPSTRPQSPQSPSAPAETVEVCRFPIEAGGDGSPGERLGEISLVSFNLDEQAPHDQPLANGPCDELPPEFGAASRGLAGLSIQPEAAGEARPAANALPGEHDFRSWFGQDLKKTYNNALQDYSNYYRLSTLGQFVVILAPAAVFANSNYDAEVGNWYQMHIRSNGTNEASNYFRPLGNGFYTIPFYVSAKFVGEYFDDQPGMALLGEFGDRTSRALLVGAPPFLALQYLTGGGRPSIYADESYWRPFRGSHGASGHAFMGAVPFLTMAGMTDEPLAKAFFYACSPWAGFTRINDNVHYTSQVWLGWWMAFLATESVYNTEKAKGPTGPLTLTPICTPDMTGVGFVYEH
jgi:hypothetical protein